MEAEVGQFKSYLERRYPGRSTSKHYMSDLGQFQQFMGPIEARQVKTKDIERFVQQQSQQGLKATTINRRLSSLSSFFDYLIATREADNWSNPVNWKYLSIRVGRHLPRDVTDETIKGLFEVIGDRRDQALFSLMLKAGLRVGEVVALELTDLELGKAESLVRLRVRGKGDKQRVVWLTAEVMQLLQAWLVERSESQQPYLFLNQHGGALSVSGVQFRLKQYCLKAGVKLSCHQLRHTFARRLVEHQMSIDSLAKLLGHNDLQTTQRYIDGADPLVRQDFLGAMQRLDQGHQVPLEAPEATFFPASASLPEPRPEPEALLDKLKHLGADLPDWLQSQLRAHSLRRSRRWPAHRLKVDLSTHFASLCRISRWLVSQRHWRALNALKRADLAAYVAARQAEGLKARSIATELTTFRIFWQDLLKQELVSNAAVLQVEPPPAPDPLPRYLTGTEFQRLEQFVQRETQDDEPEARFNRAWFYLLSQSGLRLSELTNLRLSDCDLSGRRLRVQSGKGDRDRVVPLTEQLVPVLQAYLTVREQSETDHLLLYQAKALKPTLISARLRRWGHKVQIEPLTPHRLRHTLATFLLNQGMPITSLQKFLGHQDINLTLLYARVYDETVQQQFRTAMAQIETLVVTDWPVPTPAQQPLSISLEQICDSV